MNRRVCWKSQAGTTGELGETRFSTAILLSMKWLSRLVVTSALAVTSALLGCTASSSATSSNTGAGVTGLKHAASAYARATLTGSFADLEAAFSAECRSTDHVTAQNFPLLRVAFEHQSDVSFHRVRITGVRVRNVKRTNAEAEVEYNTPKAGNYNWVTFVLKDGRWKVGGQCSTPIGNSESSG